MPGGVAALGSFGSCDSSGEALPCCFPLTGGPCQPLGGGVVGHCQSRAPSLIQFFSFPASCSNKFLIRRIHSLPVSPRGSAGLSQGGGRILLSPWLSWEEDGAGESRGWAAPLTPLPAPQPRLLGASPVLKNISHSWEFNDCRASEQRDRREPEDKVRGAGQGGGWERGRGMLMLCIPPCHRRGLSSRSRRGRVSAASCPLVMELWERTPSPGDPALHLTCW